MRAITSAKLTPAAATSILTSPGPIGGSGRSSTASTLGGPCLVITTARTRAAYSSAQVDGPAVDEALGRDDLPHDLRGHERVGRHDHRCEAMSMVWGARAGGGAFALVVGRVSDRGRGDVDAVLTEEGAHAADHSGHVGVAEDGYERLELDRQAPALDL